MAVTLARTFALAVAASVMSLSMGACAASGDSSEAGLSIIPVTIKAGTAVHRFNVEVARTGEEQQQGLMYRDSLPADGGMLFPFPRPKYASFWMKNTLIPLDIFFVRTDGSIDRIAENTTPQSLDPIVSGGEVAAVLELAGGTAARLGIEESATITWHDSGQAE